MDNDKEASESKRALQDKVNYCDCIIATLREPFIVLDHDHFASLMSALR